MSWGTWMDLEIVILSEVSQTEKEKYRWYRFYMESKKKWYKWMYFQNRSGLTDLENELMVTGVGGQGWREGTVREFGIDMYTLPYLKRITHNQQGPTV